MNTGLSTDPSWWISTLLLAWKFVGVGVAWGWLLWPTSQAEAPRWRVWLHAIGRVLVLGVTTSVLLAVALAEVGIYTVAAEVLVLATLTLAGIAGGVWRARDRFLRCVRAAAPGALSIVVGVAVILNLPLRGEWILGGWDPGVYINQGVAVSRSGSFHPAADGAYAALEFEERTSFTRGEEGYRECFPGVPVNQETGAIQHYFFRLTPATIASLHHSGGLRAALCVNLLMGLLAAVVFASFLSGIGCRGDHVAVSALVLLAQPLFLYHLNVPTSEMLHLFLLCSMGLLLPLRAHRLVAVGLLGVLLVAGLLNRISFVPFSGFLLVAIAWLDIARTQRRRVLLEHALLVAAVGCGFLFDLRVNAVTVVRLAKHVPLMRNILGLCVAGVCLMDAVAAKASARRWMADRVVWVTRAGGAAALGILLAFVAGWGSGRFAEASGFFYRLVPFLGGTALLCAVLGGGVLCWKAKQIPRELAAMLFIFVFVALGLLVKGQIAPLYPWATRRHVPYAIPAIAILVGYVVSWLWSRSRGRCLWAWRVAAVALLISALVGVDAKGRIGVTARRAKHAWVRTEYNGLVAALETVAAQIDDDDIVVVDHPWWATPLTFVFEKRVLNARQFYAHEEAKTIMRSGMRAVDRLLREGRTVRLLTSTADGLKVYPLPVDTVSVEWESDEVLLKERVQGQRVDGFHLKERRFVFRLHALKPASGVPDES